MKKCIVVTMAALFAGCPVRQLTDCIAGVNKRQAAYYYMEAEKHALLTKREARWLLSYYKDGGDIQLTDEDVKRLEAFSY